MDREGKDSPSDRFTRRTALASIAGLAALAGCPGTESSSTESPANPRDHGTDTAADSDGEAITETPGGTSGSASSHDHSGTYGSPSHLGQESPVDQIDVTDLVTKESPVVDVRAYGVVGDGETDDTEALQQAVDAATPHGVLYIPSDLVVRFESPIDIDLSIEGEGPYETANRFAFICDGAVRPGEELGDAITIHDGFQPYVFLRVEGGGSVTENPDGNAGAIANIDTALAVTKVRAGYFEGFANEYDGTVIRFFNDPSVSRQIGNTANCSIGMLRAYDCAQAIFMRDVFGLGEIGDVWDRQPIRCPTFIGSWDISINQYENVVVNTDARTPAKGLRFDYSGSIWIDKLALGGTSPHLDSLLAFRSCVGVQVNTLFVNVAANSGVHVENSTLVNFGRVRARRCGIGLRITESSGGKNPTRAVRANLDAANCVQPFVIESDVTGDNIWITGTMAGYKRPARIAATELDFVRITNAYFDSNRPAVSELALADGTAVRIDESHIPNIDGQPKLQNGTGTTTREADLPDQDEWQVGDEVYFTDLEDGSGDGLYRKLPNGDWYELNGDVKETSDQNEKTSFDASIPQTGGGVADEPTFEIDPEGNTIKGSGEEVEASDISADVYTGYDADNLYLTAELTDDSHVAVAGDTLWKGDSLQLGFGADGQFGSKDGFSLADGETTTARIVDNGLSSQGIDAVDATLSREDTTTTYELTLPWTAVFGEQKQPGDSFGFSVLINDRDSQESISDDILGWAWNALASADPAFSGLGIVSLEE